jgi:undecaprenyl phosphate N,N'-diacetylbacillosamine 1-phosphate transferase
VPGPPNTLYAKVVKRQIDIVVTVVAILLTLPLMLFVAIAVRLALGSPILFYDERAGLDGRLIRVRKFRSMSSATDLEGRLLPDGARLGRFGRFLRRTSLDELPQLFNVLLGDMSLIGPRPLPCRYVCRYSARQRLRLRVRPGLSGLSQVMGRNSLDWERRLELDAVYVESLGTVGLSLDLWIMFRTSWTVLAQAITGRGICSEGSYSMHEFYGEPKYDE